MVVLTGNKRLYDRIDFKDRNTLKQLIEMREQFISTSFSSRGSAYDRNEPNQMFYDDIMLVYLDLDALIDKTDITDKRMRLLNLVMSGYSLYYIYTNFENYNQQATIKMFNRTLDKIAETQKLEEVKEERQDEDKTP